MAINLVQPLKFTASELTDARDFLAEADTLVTDVKSLSSTAVISRRLAGSRTFRIAWPLRLVPLSA